MGKGTAEELRTFVKQIHFIGTQADTIAVGKDFAKIAGNQKVLFLIAKGSRRTIQKQFDKYHNVIDCIVYETLPLAVEKIPEYEVIVFTSPSSVESYTANHTFAIDKRYIAIGKSTHLSLLNFGLKHAEISEGFTDKHLLNAVLNSSL